MEHAIVYHEKDRYAGWPANNGVWSWCGAVDDKRATDEIVVGFTGAHIDHSATGMHPYDRERPKYWMQARSLDGGVTWEHGVASHSEPPTDEGEFCPGSIDFTHPDFAMKLLYDSTDTGSRSWFVVSTDRCRSWRGPWRIPNMGLDGLSARTDYQVIDSTSCMVFMTAAQADGPEGPVYTARITNGGSDWELLPVVGRDDPEFFTIMPASISLGDGRYLAALRCAHDENDVAHHFIDLYASDDDCQTWRCVSRPAVDVGRGNPPAMIQLRDGRMAITYGDRRGPFRICGRVSDDTGATWGPEIVLRDDGGCHDLGYPRMVERADGKLVTIYYFNTDLRGERTIDATIWDADEDA